MLSKKLDGFTLIELLTVIVIIAILFSIVAFAAAGARSNARDERRKADLAELSSGLEVYRAECGSYPTTSQFAAIPAGGSLRGNGTKATCVASSIYLTEVPRDPESPNKTYSYNIDPTTGKPILCAALEVAPVPTMQTTSCSASCGASSCNYLIVSP